LNPAATIFSFLSILLSLFLFTLQTVPKSFHS